MKNNCQELEKRIAGHAYRYYMGEQDISDLEFDSLVEELRSINPNSRALDIGWGGCSEGFSSRYKSPHYGDKPVGSLDKIKFPEPVPKKYCHVLGKFDGGSIVVYYNNGVPISAVTRHDGFQGQNVLMKLIGASCIPLEISYKGFIGVRGEVYIPLDLFAELEERGVPNPRNYVNGIVNRDTKSDPDWKYLHFMPYSIKVVEDDIFRTKSEVLEFIEDNFSVHHPKYKTPLELQYQIIKDSLPIDGLVLIAEDLIVTKSSDGMYDIEEDAIAYKFEGEITQTRVLRVEWTTGDSGRVNPVVVFTPVTLDGSTIERATGHSYQNIKTNNISAGCVIDVTKANGIIPEVVSVRTHDNTFDGPERCSVCGCTSFTEKGAHIFCANPSCYSKERSAIARLWGLVPDTFGLSWATIDKFLADISELYNIVPTLDEFIGLIYNSPWDKNDLERRYGAHYGSLLFSHIYKIRTKLSSGLEKWEFWYILNMENLSTQNAKKITTHPAEFLETYNLEFNGTVPYNAVSSIMSNTVRVEKVFNSVPRVLLTNSQLENLSPSTLIKVCYTGKTDKFKTRKEFFIEFADSVIESSVESAEYLICNKPSSSSKYKKAESLGIPIVTEEEFVKILAGEG